MVLRIRFAKLRFRPTKTRLSYLARDFELHKIDPKPLDKVGLLACGQMVDVAARLVNGHFIALFCDDRN